MEVYVVYYDPSDYPGLYVVRRQVAGRGTVTTDREPLTVAKTLKEARQCIPAGLERFQPSPDDDPVIVETWF